MKSRAFTEELFVDDDFEIAKAVLGSGSENFQRLVAIARLNPKTDFCYADLSNVDFSDADLTGYNFEGADLRGACGVNIRMDETTCFSGADVEGSVFVYEVRKREFFRSNPLWQKEYTRLGAAYWTEVELWLGEKQDMLTTEEVRQVVLRICAETNDPSVKSSILHYSAVTFDSAMEYRDFLFQQLSLEAASANTIRTALRILVRLCPHLNLVFFFCRKYLEHPSPDVREIALTGIFSSGNFDLVKLEVAEVMKKEGDGGLRKFYLKTILSRHPWEYEIICRDQLKGSWIDYRVPLTGERIGLSAKRLLLETRVAGDIKNEDVALYKPKVIGMFNDLIEDGIPFEFA